MLGNIREYWEILGILGNTREYEVAGCHFLRDYVKPKSVKTDLNIKLIQHNLRDLLKIVRPWMRSMRWTQKRESLS